MPMLKPESLEAVRNIPLYEIVAPTVNLSKAGKDWRGLSPFTNEKTPSFYVIPDKNFFKCFSSGHAGDGIKYLQLTENLEFMDAVAALAERFNITLEYMDGGTGLSKEARGLKRELIDLHDYMAQLYHEWLLGGGDEGAQGRAYWTKERGFKMATAEAYRIGLAPVAVAEVLKRVKKQGFSLEALKSSGLFLTGRDRDLSIAQWGLRFRGRLMIPIRDVQGQVIAFTARQLPWTPDTGASAKAKYINSPETPLFTKGQMLFNLDCVRQHARDARSILMVEGQLDAIRCAEVGVHNVVAPQGTSVTEAQLRLVKRFGAVLEMVLDGDRAGVNAAIRVLPLALRVGLDLRVLPLSAGTDPDELLRAQGAAAVEALRANGVSGVRFAVAQRYPKAGQPLERSEALQALFAMLCEADSEVARSAYLSELIEETGLPAHAVERDFRRHQEGAARRERMVQTAQEGAGEAGEKAGQKGGNKLTTVVSDLLWLVLQNADWAHSLAQQIDPEWLTHAETLEGRLLRRVLGAVLAGEWEGIRAALHSFENEGERNYAANLYVEDRDYLDIERTANEGILWLAKQACRRQMEAVDAQLRAAYEARSDGAELVELAAQKRELRAFLLRGTLPAVRLNVGEAGEAGGAANGN